MEVLWNGAVVNTIASDTTDEGWTQTPRVQATATLVRRSDSAAPARPTSSERSSTTSSCARSHTSTTKTRTANRTRDTWRTGRRWLGRHGERQDPVRSGSGRPAVDQGRRRGRCECDLCRLRRGRTRANRWQPTWVGKRAGRHCRLRGRQFHHNCQPGLRAHRRREWYLQLHAERASRTSVQGFDSGNNGRRDLVGGQSRSVLRRDDYRRRWRHGVRHVLDQCRRRQPGIRGGGIEAGTVTGLGEAGAVHGDLNLKFGADGENATGGLRISGWANLPGVTETLSPDGKTLTATIDGSGDPAQNS